MPDVTIHMTPEQANRFDAIGRTLQIEPEPVAPPVAPLPTQRLDNTTVHIVVPMSWPHYPQLAKAAMEELRRCPTTRKYETNDCSISSMRNAGVKAALADGATHVLFVDADMVFESDALERMLAHDVGVVGGLCRSRVRPFASTLYRRDGAGTLKRMEPEGAGLQEFQATGGAFLLVAREVFEGLDKLGAGGHYFRDCRDRIDLPESERVSEDLFFCQLLEHAGHQLYVDLDVVVGHLATGVVTDKVDEDGSHHAIILLPKGIDTDA